MIAAEPIEFASMGFGKYCRGVSIIATHALFNRSNQIKERVIAVRIQRRPFHARKVALSPESLWIEFEFRNESTPEVDLKVRVVLLLTIALHFWIFAK